MARLEPTSLTFPEIDYSIPKRPCSKAQEESLLALKKISDAIDFTNQKVNLKGALIGFGVGDGTAFYVVSKNSPLTLQHVPYSDAWRERGFVIKAVDRDYILGQLGISGIRL